MLTVYVIWSPNQFLDKETITGSHRNKKQAELISNSTRGSRVEPHVILLEDIKRIRQIRLLVAKNALVDIKNIQKTIKCESDDLLVLRAELTRKIREATDRLESPLVHDDEIERYLWSLEM